MLATYTAVQHNIAMNWKLERKEKAREREREKKEISNKTTIKKWHNEQQKIQSEIENRV